MKKKIIAGIVLIMYFFSMVLNLYPVYAESEGVNTNNYVIFPDEIEVIDGIGTGTISLAEEVSEYAISYQKMVLEENEYNTVMSLKQMVQNHTEYIETSILPQLPGEWIEIEKTANNLHLDFKNYSGTIYYVLLVKITDGTNTYYNINGYTNNIEATEQVESVTISKTSANIKVDETLQLTATSTADAEIAWTSSDNTIATVSNEGLVTGVKEGIAVITAKGNEKTATCTITVGPKEATGTEDSEDEEWTDFSKAKFELKKDGVSDAILEISNVTPKEMSSYYLFITSNNSKPNVTSDELEESINLTYDSENKMFTTTYSSKVAKYVELNQDLYVSILEVQNLTKENVILYGKKLERFAEPKYSDAFSATYMCYESTQIITTFTHDYANDRNIQIKVGKITDTAILQKIKSEDSSGFADLLAFAKSNNGIYNQKLTANKDHYAIAYDTDDNFIDLEGLQDEAYYFLYVETYDENGKYISNEAVTLAQASVYETGEWYLFFYGDEDFEWADFGEVKPDEDTKEPNDDTKAPVKLPNTGIGKYIAIISVLAVVVIASYIQVKKMKEIR